MLRGVRGALCATFTANRVDLPLVRVGRRDGGMQCDIFFSNVKIAEALQFVVVRLVIRIICYEWGRVLSG